MFGLIHNRLAFFNKKPNFKKLSYSFSVKFQGLLSWFFPARIIQIELIILIAVDRNPSDFRPVAFGQERRLSERPTIFRFPRQFVLVEEMDREKADINGIQYLQLKKEATQRAG